MLNLSINEQKQILGGYYQVTVFARNGAFIANYRFGNLAAAQNCAAAMVRQGKVAQVREVR